MLAYEEECDLVDFLKYIFIAYWWKTVLDKNIGAGCPVHVFEKATGTLIYTTETDSESFIYVPNLLKNVKYFVVATDKNDMYSSIIFDLNWDFAQQSGSKYNLKYYNKK